MPESLAIAAGFLIFASVFTYLVSAAFAGKFWALVGSLFCIFLIVWFFVQGATQ